MEPSSSLSTVSHLSAGTRKRVKVTHDDAEVRVSKAGARAPRRKVRGLLKALPDMPLDVLEEIFSRCDLPTLVSVARTNKSFCRLLQSPAYIHIWRAAFNRDLDIPRPPEWAEDWSLARWAGLLFGERKCQVCAL